MTNLIELAMNPPRFIRGDIRLPPRREHLPRATPGRELEEPRADRADPPHEETR